MYHLMLRSMGITAIHISIQATNHDGSIVSDSIHPESYLIQ